MMTVKINRKGSSSIIKISGMLEEIAKYYFSSPEMEVESIEILDGWENENEYFRQIPIEIYRANEKEAERFQLYHDIRFRFFMEYKKGQAKNHISSCGLCRI